MSVWNTSSTFFLNAMEGKELQSFPDFASLLPISWTAWRPRVVVVVFFLIPSSISTRKQNPKPTLRQQYGDYQRERGVGTGRRR